MNVLFHYYAIRYLCGAAGFADAESETIAKSSQFVDDSIHDYDVDVNGKHYRTLVTQDYVFWDDRISRKVYLPFHFFPGDAERASRERKDKAHNAFVVTPNSDQVKEVLLDGLKTRNFFRIGIALHTFADSWAHQHFTGRIDEFNALQGYSILPAVGHLPALTKPDEHDASWTDERLVPELSRIVNLERFMAAAGKIYRYLRTFRHEGFEDEEFVLDRLFRLLSSSGGREGVASSFVIEGNTGLYNRREWLVSAGIFDETSESAPFGGYNKMLWLKAQASRRLGSGDGVRRVSGAPTFFSSDLFQWNEAAREHIVCAERIIKNSGKEKSG